MTSGIKTGSIHHVTLTVTQLRRSIDFYTSLFGFQPIADLGQRVLMYNGSMVLAVTMPPDPVQALPDDCFNENRVGLDHISFNVDSKAALDEAEKILDERGVPHGAIKDLGSDMRLYVMAVRDPDNIQIELTAPYAQ